MVAPSPVHLAAPPDETAYPPTCSVNWVISPLTTSCSQLVRQFLTSDQPAHPLRPANGLQHPPAQHASISRYMNTHTRMPILSAVVKYTPRMLAPLRLGDVSSVNVSHRLEETAHTHKRFCNPSCFSLCVRCRHDRRRT